MLSPKKKWGQNFLNDPNIAKKSEQKILGNNNKINYYLKKNRIKEFKFILEN